VAQGMFRGDLLARLRELSVTLPPLRERREDLYLLVLHFLARLGKSGTEVNFPFMLALAHYDWPYNVRELESAVRVAVTLSDGGPLDLAHLPETVRRALDGHGTPASADLEAAAMLNSTAQTYREQPPVHAVNTKPPTRPRGETPSEAELRELLIRHQGNIAAVGRELGKERMQVHRWLRRYNLDIEDFRR